MKKPFLDTASSNFRQLRERGAVLVDKSLFIRDLLDAETSLVIPRPRRFGKTTNLDMAAAWFNLKYQDQATLFAGMKILADEESRAHMGKHPVIALSLKDWQSADMDELRQRMAMAMSSAVAPHRTAWSTLEQEDQEKLAAVAASTANIPVLQGSLKLLCQALARYHGTLPLVLIDEYDAPIHSAYAKGFYREAIDFLRPWISAAFKDNEYLFKGVLTGILRISRESLFSGLNNVEAYTVLRHQRPRFLDKFGFTEGEVADLLRVFGKADQLEACRAWYNGYQFGPHTIYNPWSITHFIGDGCQQPQPYWVNTSNDLLLWNNIMAATDADRKDLQAILAGNPVRREVSEATQLFELPRSNALWSLLVLSGYLKATDPETIQGRTSYLLDIPNFEVACGFSRFTEETFAQARIDTTQLPFNLLAKDQVEQLHKVLRQFFMGCASVFDGGRVPENFVHGLLFGICAHLRDRFHIFSNPETGEGRADLLMWPRSQASGLAAKVIEIKIADESETLEQALDRAFAQIETRNYAARLREAGFLDFKRYAIAVKGKQLVLGCR